MLQLFNLLETLLVDQEDQPADLAQSEDFAEEQELVASLVHAIRNDAPEVHLKVSQSGSCLKIVVMFKKF